MSTSIIPLLLYFIVLFAAVRPLGKYLALALGDERRGAFAWLLRWERPLLHALRLRPDSESSWHQYARDVLMFSGLSFALVYAIQRCQASLPWNPAGFPDVNSDLAFNTAISFMTNTNWQAYGGESSLSYLTQMVALGSQNFLSAAVGLAGFLAITRGFSRTRSSTIGNFYVDLMRSTLYVLLPLSIAMALALCSQGVVQTLAPYSEFYPLESHADAGAIPLPLGPAASQIAIKQLGTNGGGFFNANSAHPFENPTALSNFLESLAILLIPAALCYTFGELVRDRRQGWALLLAMTAILLPCVVSVIALEQSGNPAIAALGVDVLASDLQPGGNMEGKEVRFGVGLSALWSVITTAASNGSVNAMHDSFTPLGGLFPMVLMQLGEVVFGGVGSGLYGMLMFAIVTVFIAGLMVGRTPEYLGKKIGAFEIKMASIAILLPCISVLVGTAVAVASPWGRSGIANPGPHGFSEILYALSSASNNNGSAFGGLSANTPFYNGLLGLAMFLGRFGVLLPVLAIAGSLAAKNTVPAGPGTLPTHQPLFVVFLITIVLLVGALSFFPALAIGPIVEHLQLQQQITPR